MVVRSRVKVGGQGGVPRGGSTPSLALSLYGDGLVEGPTGALPMLPLPLPLSLSLSCALNLARVFGRLMRCDVTGQRFELALTGSAGAEPWKRRNEQRSLDEEEGFGFSGNLRKSSAATGSAAGSFVFFSVSFFLRFGSCVCACVCVLIVAEWTGQRLSLARPVVTETSVVVQSTGRLRPQFAGVANKSCGAAPSSMAQLADIGGPKAFASEYSVRARAKA